MPYTRPSLTELRGQVAQDIAAALPGADPLLRFSNLGIMGQVQAGLAHLHYGYLDWIAQQAVPVTATQEFLEGWAALKGTTRLPAAQATGTVTFTGTDGSVIDPGVQVVRGDGRTYTTTTGGTVAGGTVTVTAIADADPAGLLGEPWNCPAGTAMSLAVGVDGVQVTGVAASAFTGGADLEPDDSLRERMLLAFRSPAHGGNADDYVAWAREVPGVTRAWCVPHGYGAGTVLVYFMLDVVQAVYGGFPQGANGVSTGEARDITATGDQLTVADHIFPLQPVTALVYALAPTAQVVGFTIAGLSSASTTTKDAVAAAIRSVLQDYGSVSNGPTTVLMSIIESAIAAVPGTVGFLVTNPGGNIIVSPGHLPVLGAISWA